MCLQPATVPPTDDYYKGVLGQCLIYYLLLIQNFKIIYLIFRVFITKLFFREDALFGFHFRRSHLIFDILHILLHFEICSLEFFFFFFAI